MSRKRIQTPPLNLPPLQWGETLPTPRDLAFLSDYTSSRGVASPEPPQNYRVLSVLWGLGLAEKRIDIINYLTYGASAGTRLLHNPAR